jgi:predicted nucleotide-binding protein (sugar kinase/HSP70/actin superfamily)
MDNKQRKQELLNAAKQAGEQQRKGLKIDFDQAYEAYKADGNEISVTFEGREYSFPSELPASVMATLIEKGFKLSDMEAIEMLRDVIGDDFIKAIRKSRAPLSLITETVINPIFKNFGFTGATHVDEGAQGNALTPDS